MQWDNVVKKLTPYIVKIETPSVFGTGFLCVYNKDNVICGIATALHVVKHAYDWQEPIKVTHYLSGQSKLLNEPDRFIFTDRTNDSAVITFLKEDFPLPASTIPMFPVNTALSIGSPVGWLGFPSIDPNSLCFFSGNISASQEPRKAYLIDGVAINGVSGGPVFSPAETDGTQIIGIISAYHPNKQYNDALPGLSIAQDVSHFHEVTQKMRSLDEAREREKEAAKEIKEG